MILILLVAAETYLFLDRESLDVCCFVLSHHTRLLVSAIKKGLIISKSLTEWVGDALTIR